MMNLDNDVKVQNMLLHLVSLTVNGEIETVALLNSASTHSFVKKLFTDRLSLKGTKAKLNGLQ